MNSKQVGNFMLAILTLSFISCSDSKPTICGQNLNAHASSIRSVTFSPDGKLLASGAWDNTIKLWDMSSGKLLKTLQKHEDSVWSVSFSPDGTLLASGGSDQTIQLWEIPSGKVIKTLHGHSYRITTLVFSPDGKFLASGSGGIGSSDNTIRLWEIPSGTLVKTLIMGEEVADVSFSPNSRQIAARSDNTIKLWEIPSGKLLKNKGVRGHSGLSFSPNGKFLALGSENNKIEIFQMPSVVLFKTLFVPREEKSFDIKKISPGAGAVIKSFGDTLRTEYTVTFSPDGKLLASGSRDNTIKLWEFPSGKLLKILKGHSGSVLSVTFSPDGKLLASGGRDQTIQLWEIPSGNHLSCLPTKGEDVLLYENISDKSTKSEEDVAQITHVIEQYFNSYMKADLDFMLAALHPDGPMYPKPEAIKKLRATSKNNDLQGEAVVKKLTILEKKSDKVRVKMTLFMRVDIFKNGNFKEETSHSICELRLKDEEWRLFNVKTQ